MTLLCQCAIVYKRMHARTIQRAVTLLTQQYTQCETTLTQLHDALIARSKIHMISKLLHLHTCSHSADVARQQYN